ncbi:hypothetical protein ACHQM5_017881 [Ranunculus cassubicifolius]
MSEKRQFLGQDQTPEQPLKIRQKLDDSHAMEKEDDQPLKNNQKLDDTQTREDEYAEVKAQSDGARTQRIYGYCEICKGKDVTHWYLDCPQKERQGTWKIL